MIMPKGKPQTAEEENDLGGLIPAGRKIDDIAAKIEESKEAIFKKIERLGLEVV